MSNAVESGGENAPEMPSLFLKAREERRLRAGHDWVYSNEIDVSRSPLKTLQPGQPVVLRDHQGKALGSAYVNPHSLISARRYAWQAGRRLDASLLRERLVTALQWRERVYAERCYRWVYGESDGLPGLVVDRFGDVLSAQFNTVGMEQQRDTVLALLRELVDAKVIVLHNEASVRALEQLPQSTEVVFGDAPSTVTVHENGVVFQVPLLDGQKTGWFFDHRDNRARLLAWVKGAELLDVFSYAGAWGVQAAVAGAHAVTCVDSSARAIEAVAVNAQLNGVANNVTGLCSDAFVALRELREAGRQFDVVVLDPPALIKRKKDHAEGIQAYRQLNKLALALLREGGMLVSASCSFHLSRDELLSAVRHAGLQHRMELQLVAEGSQAMDHPVHPAMPETQYLKALYFRVLRRVHS
jgi:23S rRNA (cytosine1962-C5)-methyltransferase